MTHNGKQLILTVMLTSVVVYIYAVIAFNFFRKFYAQEGEDGDGQQYKCNDLLTVSIYRLRAKELTVILLRAQAMMNFSILYTGVDSFVWSKYGIDLCKPYPLFAS